ncbi:hypothetical protein QEZ54_16960 [Catellatospora sp. KI3]|uniref:hypothetical protein n=1 Tax=Catellatospora sp. KI3 TaxID=3041620 RepID=UPI002482464B|nr:hypothetical protein [Catellatospora sp. KI3]MDI1462666.1 hypothetical protein [Catellatospora sp. KI3]
MTNESVPQADSPRELLAVVRDLTSQVRAAQRGTWFPLLVLAVVTLAAIPVYRFAPYLDLLDRCQSRPGHVVCPGPNPAELLYWTVALLLAYALIAAFYVRQSRRRGVGTTIRPYVLTGVALAVLATAVSVWLTLYPLLPVPADPFAAPQVEIVHAGPEVWLLNALGSPTAVIGLALLVLAWVERYRALLAYSVGYLVLVVAVGSRIIHSDSRWYFLPDLLVAALVLLLGAAVFARFRPTAQAAA